jgi:phosphatidylinositol alpha-1,6-mannosyltransferase
VTVIAPPVAGASDWDRAATFSVLRTTAAWGGARSIAVLGEMAVLLRKVHPDIVLAGHVMTLPAMLGVRRQRTAAMLYGGELWSPRVPSILDRLKDRVASWVAISRFTAGEAVSLGIQSEQVAVVYPGAEAPRRPEDWRHRLGRLGLTDSDGEVLPYILTVSRLREPHKGIDVTIGALPALVSAHPGLRYVVAGDGPLRRRYEQIAAAMGIRNAVLLVGEVDEETKGVLMAGARAFVMPSRASRAAGQFEGFGIAYLEAALAGVSSVGSTEGAVPEVVLDEETGLLAYPRSTDAVAGAILRLLDDSALAARLGKASKIRAERDFTWDAFARKTEELLAELLQ